MNYDGSITFNTKIDDSGFEKGTESISSKALNLKNKISATKAEVEKLTKELEQLSNQPIKSKEAISLEKNIASTESKLKALYAQADTIGDNLMSDLQSMGLGLEYLDDMLAENDGWQKIQAEIDKTEASLEQYKQQLQQVSSQQAYGKDTEEYSKKQQKLQTLTDKLNVYEVQLSELNAKEQKAASATNKASKNTSRYSTALKATRTALSKLASTLGKVCSALKNTFTSSISKQISKIGHNTSKTSSQMNVLSKLLKRIKQTIASMLLYKVLHGGLSSITDGIKDLVKVCPDVNKQMSALTSSLSYLKASFTAAFAPLLNVVTPILTSFVDTLGNATNKVGQLVAALTNQKTYTKATKTQTDYAKSLDSTTQSTEALTEANDKNLSSFDELNVMQQSSSDTTSPATDGSASYENEAVSSKFDDFAEKIKNTLKSSDWSNIGSAVAEKINTALSKIEWSKIITTLKNAAMKVVTLFNGFISSVDWSSVGYTIAKGIEAALAFLLTLISNFDFSTLGEALGTLINNALSTVNASTLATALSKLITVISEALISLITTIDFAKFSDTVISFLSNIKWQNISTVAINLLKSISKAISSVDFAGIRKAFVNGISKINWDGIWDSLVNVTTSAVQGICDLFGLEGVNTSALKTALKDVKEPIGDMFKTLSEAVKKLITPLVNKLLPAIVKSVGSTGKALSPIIDALTPLLETLIKHTASMIQATSPLIERIGSIIGKLIEIITPTIEPVLNLISQIATVLSPALDIILGIVDKIVGVLSFITQGVSDIIGNLIGTNETSISSTMQAELDHLATVSEDLTTISDNIDTTISAVDESLSETSNDIGYIDDLQERMDTLLSKSTLDDDDMQELNTIADLISEKLPSFEETWSEMIEADEDGKLKLTGSQEDIRSSIDDTINKMKEQYLTAALQEEYEELYKAQIESNKDLASATGEVSQAQDDLTEAQKRYYEAQKKLGEIGYGEDGWNDAVQACNDAETEMNAYNDALTDAQGNLLTAKGKQEALNTKLDSLSSTMHVVNGEFDVNKDNLQELRDAYENGFIDIDAIEKEYGITAEELFESTKSMAERTLEGYKKGISGGELDIINAGGSVGRDAIEGAREALGIHSPSAEFADIADYTVAGFADEIDSNTSVIKSIKKWCNNVIDAAKNVLSNTSWISHIDNVLCKLEVSFKNVFNSILNDFESFFNSMNAGLNRLIGNLNSTNEYIGTATKSNYTVYPTFSNISIPRLATGMVVPANYGEFLAVLGDNKREAEVVSPLSAMKQAMAEVLSEFRGGNGGDINLTVELDGDVVYQSVVDRNDRYKTRHGKSRLI